MSDTVAKILEVVSIVIGIFVTLTFFVYYGSLIFLGLKALYEKVVKLIKRSSWYEDIQVKKKWKRVWDIRYKYGSAFERICEKRFKKKSYALYESDLDEVLAIPEDEFKKEKEAFEEEERQREQARRPKSIKERYYSGTTEITLINMNVVTVEEADLDRLQEEIEKTEEEIKKIETVNIPENATEAQIEALKAIHPFGVEYQTKHGVLVAKLEYLKCAYDGLKMRQDVARMKDEKRAFDAMLDSQDYYDYD